VRISGNRDRHLMAVDEAEHHVTQARDQWLAEEKPQLSRR